MELRYILIYIYIYIITFEQLFTCLKSINAPNPFVEHFSSSCYNSNSFCYLQSYIYIYIYIYIYDDGPKVERLRKNIIRTFKTEGLKVTVDTKAKAVDFLDATLDLTDNSHQPYRKESNEILYVNSNSNHPPKMKQNIPDMIGKRISNLSSDDTKFQ